MDFFRFQALVRLLVFACLVAHADAVIDLNNDGIGDIFALKFDATGLSATKDTDGDGKTDAEESAAGTNPRDAASVFAVSMITANAAGVHLEWSTVLGKKYDIQSTASLSPANWQPEVWGLLGTGSLMKKDLPMTAGAGKFYRVVVQDMDSDGDGVSDWEELQIGFNPNSATSAAAGGANDLAAVTQALQSPDVVKIAPAVTNALEPDTADPVGTVATFTVTRTGGLGALNIPLIVSGTATAGVDYSALPASVTLPMGVNSVEVPVRPMQDAVVESTETVTATLNYAGNSSATVVIEESSTPTGTGVKADYWDNFGTGTTPTFPTTAPNLTRTDATVDFLYLYGSPNGHTNVNADNISATWEGYLAPATGNYTFDVQADDGARIYLDRNDGNGLQLIIDGWDGSATAIAKPSATFALTAPVAPANRYRIKVEYFETTGAAVCKLRWKLNTGGFANIPSGNVFRDAVGTTTGWWATFYNNTTFTAPFARQEYQSAVTMTNNGDWGTGRPDPSFGFDTFMARWTGQVKPQYTEEYRFIARTDDGVRLWVNNQLIVDAWANQPALDRQGKITLQGGVRYDIKMEYYESTGSAEARLYWYSPSQPKQIVPTARLYPASSALAPAAVTSPGSATALVSAPFSYALTASNGATITVSGLPSWLSYAGGIISGTPPVGTAGDFQIFITAVNATGMGTSVLNLHVENTGRAISREYWTGALGSSVANVPVSSLPSGTGTLPILQGPTDFADDYGTRIRGYITAPATGNYYFWLAASNAADLWISDDAEPVNKLKRASIVSGTNALEWNKGAAEPNQKSPWLALEAGKRYYVEILHKAGVGSDHLAVGWLKPGQTGSAPTEIVPNYALSPWVEQPPVSAAGQLFAAVLTPQTNVQTLAYGTSTVLLNADQTEATVTIHYSNLSSAFFGMHLHDDEIPGGGLANVICDLDQPGDATLLPDGAYLWKLRPASGRTVTDLINDLNSGKIYFNVHSTNYPSGEIKGYFRRLDGSQTFTQPAAPPAAPATPASDAEAARFLIQATFGPSPTDIATLRTGPMTYSAWIDNQFTLGPTTHFPFVFTNRDQTNPGEATYDGHLTFNAWWKHSITAPDQLRQRVAFALSEILVVSENGGLADRSDTLSSFYDTLLGGAFGNFRQLLEAVTLHPAMGRYLDMLRNDKPDLLSGRIPNENYAREIQQLFSIGLYRMHPDGSLIVNSKGLPIATYSQKEVIGLAHAFTGWDYNHTFGSRTTFGAGANWLLPMTVIPARHFTGPKRILNNVVLPGLATVSGLPLDPYAVHTAAQYSDQAYKDLPLQEFKATHDAIFNHPNLGPLICRQLIQRLVTSTPSRGYIYRVVSKFNDNGSGERGDLKAVVKAILTDYEARSPAAAAEPGYGKLREPLLRVTAVARAFPAPAPSTGTYTQTGNLITVTTSTPHGHSGSTSADLDFSGGVLASDGTTPSDPDDAPYGISVLSTTQFTVRPLTSLSGGFSQLAAVAPDTTALVTVTTNSDHEYVTGTSLYVDFTVADAPPDGFYTITVPAGQNPVRQYTFAATAASTPRTATTNSLVSTRAPYVVNRSGNIAMNFGDWNMDDTISDLQQTPLRAPTVFNYFEPDFSFPGVLSDAGLYTPEFQITSDTTVIRVANFLFAGLNNTYNSLNGLSSFKSGARDIYVDLRPWMLNNSATGAPWTSDVSLLFDKLNERLMGGQMSAAAKGIVTGFVGNTTNFPYGATPTETQKRDRVKAMVHLMLTSPDFATQK